MRKDLKSMVMVMGKIKNPLLKVTPEKMVSLGARKMITENNSSEKDLLVDNFATNPNDRKFGGGQLGYREEIQGYLKGINNSNEPVLRNPGDRANRNKKNNRLFDRGV
jgi:hypothetical protein